MSAPQTSPNYALSVKQPWATLIVHGLKTIEIRRWSTHPRGRISFMRLGFPIREAGWRHLPGHLEEAARLGGGIIGSAELTRCVKYTDFETFHADQPFHLNEPEWFEKPAMYGFQFYAPQASEFRPCSGWFKFFPVERLS